MCSVKLANISEALSNALAEVSPKLMIRQFLRAMHVLKRISPSDVTNGCFICAYTSLARFQTLI